MQFTCQENRKNSQGLGLLSLLKTPSLSAVGVMSEMPGKLLKAQIDSQSSILNCREALFCIAELRAGQTHSLDSTFKELWNLLTTDRD